MNNMNSRIKHSGVVDAISEGRVTVRILQTSACAHCKAARHCISSESREKTVDVYNVPGWRLLSVGDEVVVTASMRMAANALLLCFGVPLVILIAALLLVYLFTSDETVAALCSIAVLVPYYAVLYLCKDFFRRRMAFEIERGDER